MTDLDTPEALAVIKGEPHVIGYRNGTLTLPTVLLFLSSGPNLAEGAPREFDRTLKDWMVFDTGLESKMRTGCYFLLMEDDRGTGHRLRTDIRPDCVVVYLEGNDDPATLVRLFRALRDHCDPGLTLCDSRGEPLFEGEVR